MAFLLNSQAQGVFGKNEQSTQTPWRGVPEARGPMQLHRLHRLKAGPDRPLRNVYLYQSNSAELSCTQFQSATKYVVE